MLREKVLNEKTKIFFKRFSKKTERVLKNLIICYKTFFGNKKVINFSKSGTTLTIESTLNCGL